MNQTDEPSGPMAPRTPRFSAVATPAQPAADGCCCKRDYSLPCFGGTNAVASAALTSTNAAYSCHCGRSPRISMPLNKPTTGIISVESAATVGGTVVAILYQAQ